MSTTTPTPEDRCAAVYQRLLVAEALLFPMETAPRYLPGEATTVGDARVAARTARRLLGCVTAAMDGDLITDPRERVNAEQQIDDAAAGLALYGEADHNILGDAARHIAELIGMAGAELRALHADVPAEAVPETEEAPA